jgi:hypothetical protein
MDLPLGVLPSMEFHVFEALHFKLFEVFRERDRYFRIIVLLHGFKGLEVWSKLFESNCLEGTAGIVLSSASAKVSQKTMNFLK